DETHDHFARRSSSACAKYADAFFRISFARLSSRFSRSSSLSRWRSSVVRPARWPVSRSAWRTHRRSVSDVHPSLPAIDAIAAHWDGCSAPCSRTIRTARSRTSGEYRLGRAMGSILSTNGPSDNPGTVQYGDTFVPALIRGVSHLGDFSGTSSNPERVMRANGPALILVGIASTQMAPTRRSHPIVIFRRARSHWPRGTYDHSLSTICCVERVTAPPVASVRACAERCSLNSFGRG